MALTYGFVMKDKGEYEICQSLDPCHMKTKTMFVSAEGESAMCLSRFRFLAAGCWKIKDLQSIPHLYNQ